MNSVDFDDDYAQYLVIDDDELDERLDIIAVNFRQELSAYLEAYYRNEEHIGWVLFEKYLLENVFSRIVTRNGRKHLGVDKTKFFWALQHNLPTSKDLRTFIRNKVIDVMTFSNELKKSISEQIRLYVLYIQNNDDALGWQNLSAFLNTWVFTNTKITTKYFTQMFFYCLSEHITKISDKKEQDQVYKMIKQQVVDLWEEFHNTEQTPYFKMYVNGQ